MAARLVVVPGVEWDVADSYAWYESRRLGLGEEFLTCVEACIEAICRSPEIYAVVHQSYRRDFVRRFPYAVFYEHAGGVVTV